MEDVILSKLIDEQSNGIIVLNKDLVVLYANKKVREFFSSNINQLLGNFVKCNNTIVESCYCQQTSKCSECILNNAIRQLKETNIKQIIDNLKFNSDGEYINISLKISHEGDYIILEFTDLCNLYEEINFLSRMMDKSKDIMFFKDSNLKYKYANQSCADLFNCDKDEMLDKDDNELLRLNCIDELLYRKLKIGDINTLKKGNYNHTIYYKERHLNISKECIDGGILCIAADITEEKKANKRAETDVLTGLNNRRKFINDMDEILKYDGNNFYLALIDIDNLKYLNNNYGHLKGDEYLSKLGKILEDTSKGRFYRIGGDEFAGLIRLKKNALESMFDDIFDTLKSLNCNPPLTISVGIVLVDINKTYIENYKEADNLLYEAKKKGKNRFILS
ncbi:sensor domain-containing diguanylate cyclase [Terrisporobacter mayombei]|uniref:GGDEF domain-containing protein n=1 Tax=Terrisporobacter mayombei TaxID=1541 RepID=A0ABY9Q7U2_9FIRM|nr:sensor domain-containing diguanylate cyclase [Terrisporobacter mayombei]MCC3869780.1 sensor domain-containing diguanylate cyclase [Terrisporobacter mayombei]WMT83280.1 hypothetical protein TEMA_37910 [Terrisporobacter mayombei]